MHEAQFHEENCFVTLTYDEEHVPRDYSVKVRDWQLFAKRLRRSRGKFRYLHCGEYGEKNRRPHYHAVLFGEDFGHDRVLFETRKERPVYVSPTLERIWGNGFATVADFSFESAAYVARYVMKKVYSMAAEKHYRRFNSETGEEWQVKPEYVTMSRNKGLGQKWIEKFRSDVYPDDFVVYGGKKYRPPIFYDDQLEEEELCEIKEKRRKTAGKYQVDQTEERLRTREKVAESRLRHLSRKV